MRIYVPKTTGLVLLFVLVVAIVGALLVLYQSYGVKSLLDPTKRLAPLGKTVQVQQVSGEEGAKSSNKNALTIIFYYEEYESQERALGDIEVLKAAVELVEPFKSLKDYVSYKVFTSDEAKCKVDEKSNYLVCEPELIDSFRKLGTDNFKVVLMTQKSFVSAAEQARGKNSWITLSTIPPSEVAGKPKEWMGLMVTRLLGYSLGLSYESGEDTIEPSIPPEAALSAISSSGRPNCAPTREAAQEWWGKYQTVFSQVDYFQGCGGHKDYYYPQMGTLMSLDPKKESYGVVSEDYLRGVLTCFYGKGEKIVFPAGKEATHAASLKTCDTFTNTYPNFWTE